VAAVFCLLFNSFHCRNFAVSNLPTSNCQGTAVNWLLLRNNFVTLHVRPILIEAINPFQKKIVKTQLEVKEGIVLFSKCQTDGIPISSIHTV
jgi:hypothetical protein